MNYQLVVLAIVAAIGCILFLYIILNSIVKANRRDKYLRIHTNILALMAKKQGITDEELEAAMGNNG